MQEGIIEPTDPETLDIGYSRLKLNILYFEQRLQIRIPETGKNADSVLNTVLSHFDPDTEFEKIRSKGFGPYTYIDCWEFHTDTDLIVISSYLIVILRY